MTATPTKTKKVKVMGVYPLNAKDAEMDLHDFQISASDADGQITMVDFAFAGEAEGMADYKLAPGTWRVTPKQGLQKLDLPNETYFETSTSTKLFSHLDSFFDNLQVYEQFKLAIVKRSILLGSDPGIGKSALIRAFCRKVGNRDKMCIIRVDSDDVSWETMTQMFMECKKEEVSQVVLIIEDIGGTALKERHHHVATDLLNFLDGNATIFRVPTLVVDTTKFLNELGATLNDRPGRFDVVMHVEPPTDDETKLIVESFLARPLTDSEAKAILGKKFTPAYAQEAILRAALFKTTIEEAVSELIVQRKRSQEYKHGQRNTSLGFSNSEPFED